MRINQKYRIFILLGIITLISAVTIYWTIDINTLVLLREFNVTSLLLATVALILGMYFDVRRLTRLLGIKGYTFGYMASLRVILSNYFLALFTPGASGGAVAQVLMLKNYGVSVLEAVPIVLIRTIFSIFFLCVMLPVIFFFEPFEIPYVSNEFMLYSSILLIVAVFAGIAALKTVYFKSLIFIILKSTKPSWTKTILTKLNELNEGLAILYKHPRQSLLVFIESGLSLIFLYAIAPALMYAFTQDVAVVEILSRMIILNLILYFAPTPGGIGVAEALFIYLLAPFAPAGVIGIVAIAWRFFAEYIPFFMGMYAVFCLVNVNRN